MESVKLKALLLFSRKIAKSNVLQRNVVEKERDARQKRLTRSIAKKPVARRKPPNQNYASRQVGG